MTGFLSVHNRVTLKHIHDLKLFSDQTFEDGKPIKKFFHLNICVASMFIFTIFFSSRLRFLGPLTFIVNIYGNEHWFYIY